MPNWLASMKQTYEYYTVDPNTWGDKQRINTIRSSSINRDSSAETLGSASISIDELVGECYVRIYLITEQDGLRDKHPLGTFLVQTPSTNFDGLVNNASMDAYTPLIELKENLVPLGYFVAKNENIMDTAYKIVSEHVRCPVVKPNCTKTVYKDFVANADDTWLTFVSDLIKNADYELDLDEMGRVIFAPKQETDALQPVWTYDDGNSSILYPEISMDHDLYGIPNVVEVVYSGTTHMIVKRIVNDDPNSPTSTVSRGREIIHRDTSPQVYGEADDAQIEEYAKRLLKSLSTIEYTISYKHGYCPVRRNDCIRLNYKRAGFENVKARVISQTIECSSGCAVSEKAVFTRKMWGE